MMKLNEAQIVGTQLEGIVKQILPYLERDTESVFQMLSEVDNYIYPGPRKINSSNYKQVLRCATTYLDPNANPPNKDYLPYVESVSLPSGRVITGEDAVKYFFYSCGTITMNYFNKVINSELFGPEFIEDVFGDVNLPVAADNQKDKLRGAFIYAAWIMFSKDNKNFKQTYPYVSWFNRRFQTAPAVNAEYLDKINGFNPSHTASVYGTKLHNIFHDDPRIDSEGAYVPKSSAVGAARHKQNSLRGTGYKGNKHYVTDYVGDMGVNEERPNMKHYSDDDMIELEGMIKAGVDELKSCIAGSTYLWKDKYDEDAVENMFPDFKIGDNAQGLVDKTNTVVELDHAPAAKFLYTILMFPNNSYAQVFFRSSSMTSRWVNGVHIRDAAMDTYFTNFAKKETLGKFDEIEENPKNGDALEFIVTYLLNSNAEIIEKARLEICDYIASLFKSKFGYALKIDESVETTTRRARHTWALPDIGASKYSFKASFNRTAESLEEMFDDIYKIS